MEVKHEIKGKNSTFSIPGDDDRKALRQIRLYAVISLVTGTIGFASGYVLLSSLAGSMFSFLLLLHRHHRFFSQNLGIFYLDLAIGSLLPIVWMVVLRTAFASLAKVDRNNFRTLSRLTILLIIAT